MIKILKLTPKQQGLVRRLNRIIKRFEEEGVGTIIQTYDVGFSCIRFYNREKVVWSETELVEIGECEELSKQEYSGYCDREIAEELQKYDKLTWCCPDPEEMYKYPSCLLSERLRILGNLLRNAILFLLLSTNIIWIYFQ